MRLYFSCITRTPALSAICLRVVYIALPICLGSCAGILNTEIQPIRIQASTPITRLSIDSCLFLNRPLGKGSMTEAYIRRGPQPLVIHLQLDTVKKDFVLQSRNSLAYWLNIYYLGLGMLVDRHNDKRYGYPGWNYLYVKDGSIYRRRFAPIPKGTLRLSLSLPLINAFSIRSPEGQYNNGGIFGIEGGLDYFYKTDRYLSWSAGTATDLPLADKKSIPLNGFVNTASTFYTSLRANRVLGSFDIGYGIALSGMRLARTDYHDSASFNSSSTNFAVGASFSLQYRIARSLRISAIYQPDIWSPGQSSSFHYQHYFALGVAWKFQM